MGGLGNFVIRNGGVQLLALNVADTLGGSDGLLDELVVPLAFAGKLASGGLVLEAHGCKSAREPSDRRG